MLDVLAQINQALSTGRPCVHCSIIETRGSTPQKAGASMLVFPDGSQFGTLGGGCVEAEVKQQALRTLAAEADSQAQILTFNLDSNYGWDDGLICGGRMSILAEPCPAAEQDSGERRSSLSAFFQELEQFALSGAGCTEAVVMKPDNANLVAGNRYLFDAGGQLVAGTGNPESASAVAALLKPVERRPKPYVTSGAAFLTHWPRITLLIVGGGHVGLAVAKLAAEVDFEIAVMDDREMYANKERFPMAKQRYVGDIGATLAPLVADTINPSYFCLIVTRGHNHDEEALYHLAQSSAGYVGMIGSKRKIKLIYEDLLSRGISKEQLQRVYAPLGFNIGSQTVPEIAVSIVAELIACRNLGETIETARTRVEL